MYTMYKMPRCTCGEELEFDTDTDLWVDGDTATMVSHGHCPKCEKQYKWLDHYELTDWSKLEEIE